MDQRQRLLPYFSAIIIWAALSGPARGQDCRDYHAYPHWCATIPVPESQGGLAVAGNLAYASLGDNAVQVLDISNAAAPQSGYIMQGTGPVQDMTVHEDHLWMASFNQGLRGARLLYPQYPTPAVHIDFPGYTYAVECADSLLYLANGSYGIRIINISRPQYAFEVGHLDTPGNVTGLAIKGHLLYAAAGPGGLQVVDITDPSDPVLLDEIIYADLSVHDVILHDAMAYGLDRDGRISYYSLQQPEAPEYLGYFGPGGPLGAIALLGSDLFLAGESFGQLRSLESLDPLWTLPCQAPNLKAVADDGRILLLSPEHGLQILVARADALPEAEFWLTSHSLFRKLYLGENDLAYTLRNHDTLTIFHLLNPDQPNHQADLELPGNLQCLLQRNRQLLVGTLSEGLIAVNVYYPWAPVTVDNLPLPGPAMDMVWHGDHAYVSMYEVGLAIVLAPDLFTLELVSVLPLGGIVNQVDFRGERAFVGHENGLSVVDVSDPAQPAVIAEPVTGVAIEAVAVRDERLFLGGPDGILRIMDISDPDQPVEWAEPRQLIGPITQITLQENLAYVSMEDQGAFILDITDPSRPLVLGSLRPNGDVVDPSFQGQDLWFIDGGYLYRWPSQCGALSPVPAMETPTVGNPYQLGASPNPFNPRTEIQFTVPESRHLQVEVFDLRGHRIAQLADRVFRAGRWSLMWEGRDTRGKEAPSGTYLVRVRGAGQISRHKVLLLR